MSDDVAILEERIKLTNIRVAEDRCSTIELIILNNQLVIMQALQTLIIRS